MASLALHNAPPSEAAKGHVRNRSPYLQACMCSWKSLCGCQVAASIIGSNHFLNPAEALSLHKAVL